MPTKEEKLAAHEPLDVNYTPEYIPYEATFLHNASGKYIRINCDCRRGTLPKEKDIEEYRLCRDTGRPLRRSMPVKQFLSEVFPCIQFFVTYYGNNPIELVLTNNQLADDMSAVGEFISQCSQDLISQHIVSIDLGDNGLSFLPKELKGLTHLKRILVGHNTLERKDLEFLESFKELEYADVSSNPITIRDAWQTIARLPNIREIDARLVSSMDMPTIEEKLAAHEQLKVSFTPEYIPSKQSR